jgi:hypothetical protein
MPKQKSRVYQRYPGIVGEEGVVLPGVVDSNERQSRSTDNRTVCACKPIPFPLCVSLMVLMTIISLVGLIVLPILWAILTEVPNRVAFWCPAPFILFGWAIVIAINWTRFYYTFLGCYCLPLLVFYLFGSYRVSGVIDWPWYWICVPLYPMIVSVPASYFIMKHLEKSRRPIMI